MTESATSPSIQAQPYDYPLPEKSHPALIMIDMQTDLLEPGGVGEALGNDVSRLQTIVPAVQRLQAAFREKGVTIIQTKEAHRADMCDCLPSKQKRGKGTL